MKLGKNDLILKEDESFLTLAPGWPQVEQLFQNFVLET